MSGPSCNSKGGNGGSQTQSPILCFATIDYCGPSRQSGCGKKKANRIRRTNVRRFDKRIYRNGESMCISYAGHIPGEQFIPGRNLPTCTTYCKKRLCQYTPYEFIHPDGTCNFCVYN